MWCFVQSYHREPADRAIDRYFRISSLTSNQVTPRRLTILEIAHFGGNASSSVTYVHPMVPSVTWTSLMVLCTSDISKNDQIKRPGGEEQDAGHADTGLMAGYRNTASVGFVGLMEGGSWRKAHDRPHSDSSAGLMMAHGSSHGSSTGTHRRSDLIQLIRRRCENEKQVDMQAAIGSTAGQQKH